MKWWEEPRLIITVIMWGVLGIISLMSVLMSPELGSNALIGILSPLALGILSLFLIWILPELVLGNDSPFKTNTRVEHHRQPEEKSKRMSKLDILMEMMDKDERYAFKEMLKQRMLNNLTDGELNADA